jgi:hypothetical protein
MKKKKKLSEIENFPEDWSKDHPDYTFSTEDGETLPREIINKIMLMRRIIVVPQGICVLKKYYIHPERQWSIERYKDDKLHGLCESFHSNGKIHNRKNYKEGKLHGFCGGYEPDGTIIYEGNCRDGLTHGTLKQYFFERDKPTYTRFFYFGKEGSKYRFYTWDGFWNGVIYPVWEVIRFFIIIVLYFLIIIICSYFVPNPFLPGLLLILCRYFWYLYRSLQ